MSLEPKRCLGCGYILDGLPEPRCPECGRWFDPGNPDTYGPTGPAAGASMLFALAGSAALVVGLKQLRSGSLEGATIPLILVGCGANVYVVFRSAYRLFSRGTHAQSRKGWCGALLLGLLGLVAGSVGLLLPSLS
ncbi:MAG: hypothetical protein AB1716_10755 [Planctomycetota bacterium]